VSRQLYQKEWAVGKIIIVLVLLFLLSVARSPFTVFTFIGGALDIGVGCGSQNMMNNFLSGLILMMESH
jgi:small-conductance mechanosensitive channel